MRISMKVLVLALAAAAMALAAGTASATRLSVNTTRFDVRWNLPENPLVFLAPFGSNISCGVTLLGSFHNRTITKMSESLIGYVTRSGLIDLSTS